MRTSRTAENKKALALSAGLLLTTICAAADERVRREEWSGSYQCGAIASAPEKWPAYKINVLMLVDNGKASITRDTVRVQETVTGTVSADGRLTLEGGGAPKVDGNGRPWRFRFDGQFVGGKFEGTGVMNSHDGARKLRDCSITATREKHEPELKANLDNALRNPSADGATVVRARRELIRFYQRNFRPEEAIPHLQQQLSETMQRSPDSPAEAAARLDLAKQLRGAGRSGDALEHALAAQRVYHRDLGDEDRRSIDATVMVGWLQANVGQVDAGISALEKAIRQGEAKFGRDHRGSAWAKVPLAYGYKVTGRLADAERLLLEALKIFEKDDDNSSDYAAVLGDLSSVYQTMGKLNEAEHYAQQSLTVYLNRHGPQWPTTIGRMRTLAEILLDQRRHQEAQKIAERAVEYAEQYHPGTALLANTLSDLGRIYQRLNQSDRAEEVLRRAAEILATTSSAGSLSLASIRQRLATTLTARGRFDEAKPLLLQARADFEKRSKLSQGLAFNNQQLGRMETGVGNYAAAAELFKEAARMFTELKGADHPDTIISYRLMADAYYAQGQVLPALEHYRTALKGLENYLALRKTQSPQARAEQEANIRVTLGSYLSVVLERRGQQLPDGRDATEEAFAIAEQLRNRATQAAILGMSARAAVNEEELSQLVRREQDLRVERGSIETQINEGLSSSRGGGAQSPSRELIRRRNAIDAELVKLNARITGRFPKYAQLMNPTPPTLAELRSLLPVDAAILSYVVQKERTLLWVITREATNLHIIKAGAQELERRVKHVRLSLDANIVTLEDVPPYDVSAAHDLYQLLVARAAGDIAGRPHLVVIPHGPLFSLPFAALVTSPSVTPARAAHFAEYPKVPWLGLTHTVTVSPSAIAFATLRKAVRAAAAERPFIGFGDPVFQASVSLPAGKTMQRSLRDTRDMQKLSALPETNEELRLIAKALGASESELYLGARATELNVKQAVLNRYRVVAFATHGLVAGDLDGLDEPALALTPPAKPSAEDDGLLTMSEVLGLKLNADWVVLSACNTASSDGSLHGDGLSGLTQAFFYAGSRALLVTLWPVESKSAQTLTTTLFGAVRDSPKLLRTQALATAQRSMIQAAGAANAAASDAHAYAHPFFWAPFILVGEGGAN